jgi:hypothetical protein
VSGFFRAASHSFGDAERPGESIAAIDVRVLVGLKQLRRDNRSPTESETTQD